MRRDASNATGVLYDSLRRDATYRVLRLWEFQKQFLVLDKNNGTRQICSFCKNIMFAFCLCFTIFYKVCNLNMNFQVNLYSIVSCRIVSYSSLMWNTGRV